MSGTFTVHFSYHLFRTTAAKMNASETEIYHKSYGVVKQNISVGHIDICYFMWKCVKYMPIGALTPNKHVFNCFFHVLTFFVFCLCSRNTPTFGVFREQRQKTKNVRA